MPIYLTARSIPEIKALPENLQKEVLSKFLYASFRHWDTWVTLAISIFASVSAFIFIPHSPIRIVLLLGISGLGVLPFCVVHFGHLRRYAATYIETLRIAPIP